MRIAAPIVPLMSPESSTVPTMPPAFFTKRLRGPAHCLFRPRARRGNFSGPRFHPKPAPLLLRRGALLWLLLLLFFAA